MSITGFLSRVCFMYKSMLAVMEKYTLRLSRNIGRTIFKNLILTKIKQATQFLYFFLQASNNDFSNVKPEKID